MDEINSNDLTMSGVIVPASKFLEGPRPDRDWLLDGLVHHPAHILISGPLGVGRSLLVAEMASRLAAGGDLLNLRVRRRRSVLLCSSHMADETVNHRLRAVKGTSDWKKVSLVLGGAFQKQHGCQLDLRCEKVIDILSRHLDSLEDKGALPEVFILDSVPRFDTGHSESQSQCGNHFVNFVLRLRTRGISVVSVHGNDQSGQPSSLAVVADIADLHLDLATLDGFSLRNNGLAFRLTVSKVREIARPNSLECIARWPKTPDDHIEWECRELSRVATLVATPYGSPAARLSILSGALPEVVELIPLSPKKIAAGELDSKIAIHFQISVKDAADVRKLLDAIQCEELRVEMTRSASRTLYSRVAPKRRPRRK